ncbi:hypothetical protein NMG60_11030972 [Bertholletia excelsa]
MRNSLKKLKGLTMLHKYGRGQGHGEAKDRRDRRHPHPCLPQHDELVRASQDMRDMRDCYDSLLSAAAVTANSAYEFSESLRELGACLLEKTALNDDDESGKVLLMLGKLQFELQKLIDNYRSHIFQTITIPSESLLNELRTVEEMKKLCDEKRSMYEEMVARYKEKGKLRSHRGESLSSRQLLEAREEYDQEATLLTFRLKSLKQGQSRSLLTQAARHHAAQLYFFRKALKSLETVEPLVKSVTEHQHIDYHFNGLEDDDTGSDDSDNDDDSDSDGDDDNVHSNVSLSFDYGQNDQTQNVSSTPESSLELDNGDLTFPQIARVVAAKENLDLKYSSFALDKEYKVSSQSAPLSSEKQFDPAARFRQIQPLSSRRYHSYVLPTPVEVKSPVTPASRRSLDAQVSGIIQPSPRKGPVNYWHSSPLEQKKNERIVGNGRASPPSVLRESNNNITSTTLPPPLAEELSSWKQDKYYSPATKTINRHAFSGPLMGKPYQNMLGLSASGPIVSTGSSKLSSGPVSRNAMHQPLSTSKLPTNSSTFSSSPKINELHELPRPPANLGSKFSARPANHFGYSAPLDPKSQEVAAANKLESSAASPLPTPPTLPRSFSIPSSGQRPDMSPISSPSAVPQTPMRVEDIPSPPRTPISLSNNCQ